MKVAMLLVVVVANITDNALDLGGALRSFTIAYYMANEGISMLENLGHLDLPLPDKLKSVLEQLRKENK